MFGVKKSDWKLIGVAVVVVLIAIAAIANIDALERPRDALGLDSGSLS